MPSLNYSTTFSPSLLPSSSLDHVIRYSYHSSNVVQSCHQSLTMSPLRAEYVRCHFSRFEVRARTIRFPPARHSCFQLLVGSLTPSFGLLAGSGNRVGTRVGGYPPPDCPPPPHGMRSRRPSTGFPDVDRRFPISVQRRDSPLWPGRR